MHNEMMDVDIFSALAGTHETGRSGLSVTSENETEASRETEMQQ